MSKYIDAEKLKAEIERNIKHYEKLDRDDFKNGELYICQELLSFIKSLQQEQPDCHTVEDWIQHIKNADQLTKDIFSKGPYDVLYDVLNHPYQHCYDAIKVFGELCFQTGVNSVKQEQPEVDLEKKIQDWCKENVTGVKPIYTADSLIYGLLPKTARHFYELGLNARKED